LQRADATSLTLQGVFFWEFLVYLIEGMVFLITGLQARTLIAGIRTAATFIFSKIAQPMQATRLSAMPS
jgi:hypothetical protein